MKENDMAEKRWTEMTADEQVPPWGLLVDQLLLRRQLDAHNKAAYGDVDGLGACVCLADETGIEVSALCPEHGNGTES